MSLLSKSNLSSSKKEKLSQEDKKQNKDEAQDALQDSDGGHQVRERTSQITDYPYSVFTRSEKYFIAFICGISGFWSAVSGNIYYPIIFTIEKKFHVSDELANVSVVLYFIFQGIAPMFTATAADTIGRKPVVLFCCIIYVGACIGLACSNAYWLILFLRCIQAAGIAPVVAVNSGVCSDLSTRATRGSLIGFTSGIQLCAQALGALIGGLLASGFNSWRSIFWFSAIGCGVTAVVSLFFLPETRRSIVGNGSVPPKNFINKSPLWMIPRYKKKLTNDIPTLEENAAESMVTKLLDVPRICSRKETFMTLIPIALYFTTWSMMFTSLSTTLQEKRGYSVRRVGLCFLAPGVGGTLGSLVSGRFLDRYYRYQSDKYKAKLARWEETREGRKPEFNIFKCRLAMLFPCAFVFNSGLLIFAWCLSTGQPLAPILIGSFLASFVNSPFVSGSMNLLCDLNPTKTSTSTACVNLARCLLSACGVAALSRMQKSLTVGGCFTLMAGLCALAMVPMYIVMVKGPQFVKKREAKQQD